MRRYWPAGEYIVEAYMIEAAVTRTEMSADRRLLFLSRLSALYAMININAGIFGAFSQQNNKSLSDFHKLKTFLKLHGLFREVAV